MILPKFVLSSRVDQHWKYSGMDSIQCCFDVDHFKTYPHKISYDYNSRGFRDEEWPDDLSNAIWCVGDSFTVGLGCPREHTWTYLLQQQTNCSTINVSMDGASNTWIARKTIDILQQISPQTIVIQWSYIHRIESEDITLSDEDRRLHFDKDTYIETESKLEFIRLVKRVEAAKQSTKIIHSFIPNFGFNPDILSIWNQVAGPDWPTCPANLEEFDKLNNQIQGELTDSFNLYTVFELHYQLYNSIEYIPEIQIVDLARDGHHYDIKTAQQFVDDVIQLL